MTTQNKLLTLGVSAGIVVALFLLVPKSITDRFLASVTVDTPTCDPGYVVSTVNGIESCRIPAIDCTNPKVFDVGPLENNNDNIKRAPVSGDLVVDRLYSIAYKSGTQTQCEGFFSPDCQDLKGDIKFYLPDVYEFGPDARGEKEFTATASGVHYRVPDEDNKYDDNWTTNEWYYKISEVCPQAACPTTEYTVQNGVCAILPDAPVDLVATAKENGGVLLEWKAPENTGGYAITGYIIKYKKVSESDWLIIDTEGNNDPLRTQKTITGLTQGTEYIFRVFTQNGYEKSDPTEITFRTLVATDTYTVTFDSQSATTPASPTTKTVTSPATTVGSLPTPPTKNGAAFLGWYTTANLRFIETTPVTANMTVRAFWVDDDIDCDGVNDYWESEYGFSKNNPELPSDTIDTDNDGFSDKQEGLFGTNPNSSTSKPQFTVTTVDAQNSRISFKAFPGNLYLVEKSTDGTNWSPYETLPSGGLNGGGLISSDYTYTSRNMESTFNYRVKGKSLGCQYRGCFGTGASAIPANSEISLGISESQIPKEWSYGVRSQEGGGSICTFQCQSGYTYNSANNTCSSTLITPTLTTTAASAVTQTSATSGGAITSSGGSAITLSGLVWSTTAEPTIALATKTTDGTLTGSFTSNITGLTAGTLYHVRAYATNSAGTAYGNDLTFTTLAPAGAPTVLRVTSSKPDGAYRAGTQIPISVEFSEIVHVTGTPVLILEIDTKNVAVPYISGTGTTTLVFEYIVSDNQTSPDLNYVGGVNPLKIATGSAIKDVSGNNAILTLPSTDLVTSLGGNKAIVIDTTAPDAPQRPTVPTQTGVTVLSRKWANVSVNSITLNSACTTGEKVTFYNGLSSLTSTVCANSTTTATISLPSSSIYYSLTTTFTDSAGNESERSAPMIITKEQTTDTTPGVPDMDPLSDFGISSTDNLTRETQPKFTISCTLGNTVNLYDAAVSIGNGPCVGGTVQIIPTSPLSAGAHTLTAKQTHPTTGVVSSASAPLVVTIDTTPLSVTLSKASEQIIPATSPTLKFIATFSRPINTNSFVCSDVTVVNGACNSVSLISGNVFMVTVLATNPGAVRTVIYAGRVETPAGNLNAESTGNDVIVYGTGTNGQCSTLRTFTTSNPTSTSLNSKVLCTQGTKGTVVYSSSRREWTYACNGVNGGTNATCTVGAVLGSACDLKPVDELPFDDCRIASGNNFFRYHTYLSCLNIVDEKGSCTDAKCTQNAPRQDLIYIASRIRGIPLDLSSDYRCENRYTDTVRGVAPWVCEVAEKANTADLITGNNRTFRPLDTMTRAEAFKVILGSICTYPTDTSSNWQTDVAKTAIKLGFSTRTVGTFEPNRPLLRQELFVISARAAQWLSENPDNCEALPEELICE